MDWYYVCTTRKNLIANLHHCHVLSMYRRWTTIIKSKLFPFIILYSSVVTSMFHKYWRGNSTIEVGILLMFRNFLKTLKIDTDHMHVNFSQSFILIIQILGPHIIFANLWRVWLQTCSCCTQECTGGKPLLSTVN